MPAYEDEIEDALAEGIELKVLLAPKFIVKNNGRLSIAWTSASSGL
jgi:hypothetical protein